jgi:hypothetical protein
MEKGKGYLSQASKAIPRTNAIRALLGQVKVDQPFSVPSYSERLKASPADFLVKVSSPCIKYLPTRFPRVLSCPSFLLYNPHSKQ